MWFSVGRYTVGTMSGEARVFSREQTAAHNRAKYSQHFFRRVPIVTQTYEADMNDLLPQPKKVGRVDVGLADAEQIKIKTEGPKHVTYEAEPRPEILFKGTLAIADITDEPEAAEGTIEEEVVAASATESPSAQLVVNGEEMSTEDNNIFHLPVTHKHGRGHLHTYSKKEQAQLEPLSNPDGIIGMQRTRIVDRNPRGTTLKVDAPMLDTRATASPFVVAVAGLSAIVITIGLVGMYGKVSSDGGVFLEQYGFTIQELVAAMKSHITALIVHSFGQ